MAHLILGSQSPRRKEILGAFDIPFKQVSPPFDEEAVSFEAPPINADPAVYASTLSRGKALSLAPQYPDLPILTADTIVYLEGKLYEKPKDIDEAFNLLSHLQGRWHSVFTAVTLLKGLREFTEVVETRVLFNPLTPAQIRHYHANMVWADKSGGYAIQAGGGLLVRRIEGCYKNVMGLPINTVRDLLLHVGIDLWEHIKPF